jgi:hypothetical protein
MEYNTNKNIIREINMKIIKILIKKSGNSLL